MKNGLIDNFLMKINNWSITIEPQQMGFSLSINRELTIKKLIVQLKRN